MHKIRPWQKEILNSLAKTYSAESLKGTGKYLSKRCLREVLICMKWNKADAIQAIESGRVYYWLSDD